MIGDVHYCVYDVIDVDEPADTVRRITLNRPEKRNALNHPLEVSFSRRCVKVMPTRM